MNTMGVLLLAAATATGGIGKPHTGKVFLRPHVVRHGPPPAGGMINPASFGVGGADCPPGMGGVVNAGYGLGAGANRRFPNVQSQVYFVDPPGMRIGWQSTTGGPERVFLADQLVAPVRYNFRQGYIYRLKLTNIPEREGLILYPTIEVAPSTPATDAYLTHNPIPAVFTPEDFDQVSAGNFVTKVIYLPDPRYQELAIAGVETIVSTRLEPGIDPILEADRRGTILMVIRLGAIDLEMPGLGGGYAAPADAPPPVMTVPGAAPGMMLPPGEMPAPPVMEEGPVDASPLGATTAPPEPGVSPVGLPATPPTPDPVAAPGDLPSLPAVNP